MKSRAAVYLLLALTLLLGGGCGKRHRERRLLTRAAQAVQAGRYDDADLDYRAVLQLSPENPVAGRELGLLYAEEGRPARAYFLLKKAATAEPKNFALQVKLAQVEQTMGGVKVARATVKHLLEIHPPTDETLTLLITTSASQADLDESRAIIDRLRARDQDRACYHLAAGALVLFKRDVAGAEAEFRKALALDPKSAAADLEIADCYLIDHKTKEAGEAYKAAADLSPLRSAYRLRYVSFQIPNGAAAEGKKQLEEINRQAPDYLPAWVYRMKLAFQERRYDDCADLIRKILVQDDRDYDALLQDGMLRIARKDFDGAITTLDRAEVLFPRSAPIKYQLGLAYLGEGKLDLAQTSLEHAIQLAPYDEEAVVMLADLRIRAHDPGAAIAALTRLLQKRPRSGRAYLVLARAYQAENNPEQVLAALRHAQQIFPGNPQVPYLIGAALKGQGKREEARKAFEQALALHGDFFPALEMLVDDDLSGHRPRAAQQSVETAVQKYPKSPSPLVLRAKVRMAMRDFTGAQADLHQAIELDPKSPLPYLLLARLDFGLHKSQEGVAELQRLADKTNSVPSIMELAQVHTQLQQYDAARTDYERLLRIDPKFVPALNNLANLYSEHLGQLAKAEALAAQARELRPDDSAVAETLGWIEFRKGDYSGALVLIQEAAQKNPTDPLMQYHLGMVHYLLGEEEGARVAFRAVTAATASSPAKADALRRLQVLDLDPATAPGSAARDLEKRLVAEPDDPVARFHLASLQARLGASDQAAKNFEVLLKAHPRDSRTLLALAELYAGPLRNPAHAQELAKSAHELAPNDSRVALVLGRLLYRTGDYTASANLLEEAARGLSDRPDVTWELAQAQYALGQTAQAEDTLQGLLQAGTPFPGRHQAESYAAMIAAAKDPALARAALPQARRLLELEPGCLPALMVTAVAQEGNSEYGAAAGTDQKMLLADPGFSPATRQLALLYFRHLNDSEKAYKFAAQAKAAFPDDAELNKVLGILLYRRSDYTGAVGAFQRVLLVESNEAEALFYLGLCHNELKEKNMSKAELQQALDLGLSREETEKARALLR